MVLHQNLRRKCLQSANTVNKPEEVPKWLLLLLMLFTVVPFFLYVYQFDT